MEPIFASVAEFAAAIRVSEWTAKRLLRDGTVPSVKLNGRRLVPVQAIHEYADRLRGESRDDRLSA